MGLVSRTMRRKLSGKGRGFLYLSRQSAGGQEGTKYQRKPFIAWQSTGEKVPESEQRNYVGQRQYPKPTKDPPFRVRDTVCV